MIERYSRGGKLLRLPLAVAIVLGCWGCGPSPELALYREGLHAVDEPLYEAHLKLMDDAVAASLRRDVDRQTVKRGIQAARELYQEFRQSGK